MADWKKNCDCGKLNRERKVDVIEAGFAFSSHRD
jgi:hypothetical protein